MINFDFYVKTKLFFGKDKHLETGKILKEFGATRVLIIIGMNSVIKSGLLKCITDQLDEVGIDYHVLSGVRANPTAALVRSFIDFAHTYQPDFLLPIGGGSVIDTAKLLSVGYYYDGDCFDFNLQKTKPTKALPIGVVLTIAAAGSEMSVSCVVQDDDLHIKTGFVSELLRPTFAIENPELTYSVSPAQTVNGIVDMMMHTLERYFQPSSELEPADGFAESLLKSVMEAGTRVIKNPTDYEGRAVLMLMSSLSHNGLTNIGKPMFLLVHQLEHALSGVYPEVAHGAGLSVLFPAWADYYVYVDPDKFDKLARNVFGLTNEDKIENGKAGIKEIRKYFKSIGGPLTFKELGLEDVDIDKLIDVLFSGGKESIPHYKKPITREIARIIYESCKDETL